MAPTLEPEDRVWIDTRSEVAIGDIVVATHPFRAGVFVIKRVVAFDADGRARLEGDNPEASTDSRSLGSFSLDSILGRVSSRMARPSSGPD